jgi:hypothetical protein
MDTRATRLPAGLLRRHRQVAGLTQEEHAGWPSAVWSTVYAFRAVEVARTTDNRIEEIDALRIQGMALAAQRNRPKAARAFEESLQMRLRMR